MNAPKPGDRISEYLLTDLVGSGTFGYVFRAVHHIWKDRVVAVKVPTHPQYVTALRHEGVTVHGLEHPNIVRALGLDPFADPPYLVMEYVDGCSLRDLIKQHPQGLAIPTLHAVLIGVLSGLEHAHTHGVIHRDLKPENVLIARGGDGSTERVEIADVRITDFGLGQALQSTTHSIMQSGSIMAESGKSISGTLAYMSPEQRDGRDCDAATDLYAVGVMLFEMVSGERPGGTELPGQLRPGLPAWVDEVFARLYARRERRLSSATDVLAAIRAAAVPPLPRERAAARAGSRGLPPVPPAEPRVAARTSRPSASAAAAAGRGDNFCIHCGRASWSR
ncbi:MAG: serine/threonine-protein kinase [Phycisphaerae bacterium]